MRALRRQHRDDGNRAQLHSFWTGLPHATWMDIMPTVKGMPDALVGTGGRDQLIEIKQPGKRLEPEQIAWGGEWCGAMPLLVQTTDDLLQLYRAMRR